MRTCRPWRTSTPFFRISTTVFLGKESERISKASFSLPKLIFEVSSAPRPSPYSAADSDYLRRVPSGLCIQSVLQSYGHGPEVLPSSSSRSPACREWHDRERLSKPRPVGG